MGCPQSNRERARETARAVAIKPFSFPSHLYSARDMIHGRQRERGTRKTGIILGRNSDVLRRSYSSGDAQWEKLYLYTRSKAMFYIKAHDITAEENLCALD